MGDEAAGRLKKFVDKRVAELGLSYREIARQAGMSVSFLSRVLAGERGLPPDDVLLRIAKALEVDPPERILAEAGRVPEKRRLVTLMRAATELSAADLDQVNRVAAELLERRRRRKET
jgi:transcriptional regulator with XRE-family HTH domain